MITHCIYHNADLDGKCSGAIVKKYCDEHNIGLNLIGLNYGDEFTRGLYGIEDGDSVIMCDFSLPMEHMRLLERKCNFVWIDHHRTAILDMQDIDCTPAGLRDERKAGCELTWLHYFPRRAMPRAVYLLGSYDVWRWKEPDFVGSADVGAFQSAMRISAWWPESVAWKELLTNDDACNLLITTGSSIEQYQQQMMDRMYNKCWQVYWKKYTWLACNSQQCSSSYYEKHPRFNECDGLIIFTQVAPNKYIYSLRHGGKQSDLVCGDIAKQYDGGGHPGAAGFKLDHKLRVLG